MSLSKPLNSRFQPLQGDGDATPISVTPYKGSLCIDDLRKEIDEIDGEILELLRRRLEVARRIGLVKMELGLPVKDDGRERVVLERAGEFRSVFEAILEVSRDVQRLRVFQQDK